MKWIKRAHKLSCMGINPVRMICWRGSAQILIRKGPFDFNFVTFSSSIEAKGKKQRQTEGRPLRNVIRADSMKTFDTSHTIYE